MNVDRFLLFTKFSFSVSSAASSECIIEGEWGAEFTGGCKEMALDTVDGR